jgi:molybdate transport system substrate-binding protein
MGTQISIAKTAAAIGLLIALALSRDVAARLAELRVLSSAAPRNVLNEMSPVFERMTGRKLVVEYAFSPDLKHRIEAGDPFDVAILPRTWLTISWGGTSLWLVRASTSAAPA